MPRYKIAIIFPLSGATIAEGITQLVVIKLAKLFILFKV